MKVTERFDIWVERGPFTSADLGIYRIIYAMAALLTVPDISWLGQYPDFMFNTPPGPLWLLSGFPSPTVLIALEVLRSSTLIMLGLGVWTRYVSIAVWVMLSITYGLTFTLGKIDHTILLVVVPLVFAFSGWGNRFSVDSMRFKGEPPPQQQWPFRLLALLVGWAFFAAAMTKLLTGWLSFSSQAARGYFVLGFLTEDKTYLLAQWVAAHDLRAAWELLDWMTVIFEFSILIALPWWRAFRMTLAVAAIFHLGVLLAMNIDFSSAVVAYAAFVSWGAIARRMGAFGVSKSIASFVEMRRPLLKGPGTYLFLCLLALIVGSGSWLLMVNPAGRIATGSVVGNLIILLGAVVGLTYLVLELRSAVRKIGADLPSHRWWFASRSQVAEGARRGGCRHPLGTATLTPGIGSTSDQPESPVDP